LNIQRRNEWAAIYDGLLFIAGQIGELKQMRSVHPDLKKSVENNDTKYTAVKHFDLGQGVTRTYTVTYMYNPDGTIELLDVKVEE